jgi:hypothetical protein
MAPVEVERASTLLLVVGSVEVVLVGLGVGVGLTAMPTAAAAIRGAVQMATVGVPCISFRKSRGPLGMKTLRVEGVNLHQSHLQHSFIQQQQEQ